MLKIQDMLLKLGSFTYASSLDLNTGYYHIEISHLLTWGKYDCQKLLLGVCNIPDIFQERIYELFKGFYMVIVDIYDVLKMTKNDFKEHLNTLEKFQQRIKEAALKVNTEKPLFGQTETEYIGFWVRVKHINIMFYIKSFLENDAGG